jgi:hypothetical protein
MTIFFGLATPESVFAIVTGEHLAFVIHGARDTQQAGLRLATHSSLGALGFRSKEQFGATLTYRIVHPVHRWLNIGFEGFKS